MRTNTFAIIGIGISLLLLIIIALKPQEKVYMYMAPESQVVALALYKKWKNCLVDKINKYRGNPEMTWWVVGQAVKWCEGAHVDKLKIMDFSNYDETKRHILPLRESDQPSIIITLGVGHDVLAEERLLEKVGNQSVEFYGADPMVEGNDALYSKFGTFFPFAVGARSGVSQASVYEHGYYHDKLVVHVDIVYFLKNLVHKTFIDDLWLDAEGAEYELFNHFYKGSVFDANGITFCQINMEMHSPNLQKKKEIHDFIFKIIDDERYAFFLPVQATHLRLFFVNFEDSRCIEKYIHHNSTNMTL